MYHLPRTQLPLRTPAWLRVMPCTRPVPATFFSVPPMPLSSRTLLCPSLRPLSPYHLPRTRMSYRRSWEVRCSVYCLASIGAFPPSATGVHLKRWAYHMPLLPSIYTLYHLTTSAVPTSPLYSCRIHKQNVVFITCLTNLHHQPDFSFSDPVCFRVIGYQDRSDSKASV